MRTARYRRGLATVEFVMVLPVMALFAALILKGGELTMAKSQANSAARANVYQTAPAPEPGSLPDRSATATALDVRTGSYGLVTSSGTSRPVSLRPVQKEELKLTGRVAVVLGTWDHRGIPFPQSDPPLIDDRAVRAALPSLLGELGGKFAKLFNGVSIPGASEVKGLIDSVFKPLQDSGFAQDLQKLRDGLKTIKTALNVLSGGGSGGVLGGVLGGAGKIVGQLVGGLVNAVLGPLKDKIESLLEALDSILNFLQRLTYANKDRLKDDPN